MVRSRLATESETRACITALWVLRKTLRLTPLRGDWGPSFTPPLSIDEDAWLATDPRGLTSNTSVHSTPSSLLPASWLV
jgi:hypothetical protein